MNSKQRHPEHEHVYISGDQLRCEGCGACVLLPPQPRWTRRQRWAEELRRERFVERHASCVRSESECSECGRPNVCGCRVGRVTLCAACLDGCQCEVAP